MKGTILDFSIQSNTGIVSGDDGKRYSVAGAEWKDSAFPVKGMKVDFEPKENLATSVYVSVNTITQKKESGAKKKGGALLYWGVGIILLGFVRLLVPGISNTESSAYGVDMPSPIVSFGFHLLIGIPLIAAGVYRRRRNK